MPTQSKYLYNSCILKIKYLDIEVINIVSCFYISLKIIEAKYQSSASYYFIEKKNLLEPMKINNKV